MAARALPCGVLASPCRGTDRAIADEAAFTVELHNTPAAPDITNEPRLLDERIIATLVKAIGPATVRVMFSLFVAQTRACLGRLSDPECRDLAIENECHALCGAAATLGLAALSDAAAKLESRASVVVNDIDRLADTLDRSLSALAHAYPGLHPAR